jgi:hypothetical protein
MVKRLMNLFAEGIGIFLRRTAPGNRPETPGAERQICRRRICPGFCNFEKKEYIVGRVILSGNL